MSKKITLDPSIATILDIGPIGYNERVEIKFTASENWVGDFEFVVYNSTAKNSHVEPTDALGVEGEVMTLVIEPKEQSLTVGSHYYEISLLEHKRIVFKGLLNIVK